MARSVKKGATKIKKDQQKDKQMALVFLKCAWQKANQLWCFIANAHKTTNMSSRDSFLGDDSTVETVYRDEDRMPSPPPPPAIPSPVYVDLLNDQGNEPVNAPAPSLANWIQQVAVEELALPPTAPILSIVTELDNRYDHQTVEGSRMLISELVAVVMFLQESLGRANTIMRDYQFVSAFNTASLTYFKLHFLESQLENFAREHCTQASTVRLFQATFEVPVSTNVFVRIGQVLLGLHNRGVMRAFKRSDWYPRIIRLRSDWEEVHHNEQRRRELWMYTVGELQHNIESILARYQNSAKAQWMDNRQMP